MRYDSHDFLVLFHFLLICKRCSCLWPVSCSHWNQAHSSHVQILRIRCIWVSLRKPLSVPACGQHSCGSWSEASPVPQPCASAAQGFAHQRVCLLTCGRDSLGFALEHSSASASSVFAPASCSFRLVLVSILSTCSSHRDSEANPSHQGISLGRCPKSERRCFRRGRVRRGGSHAEAPRFCSGAEARGLRLVSVLRTSASEGH